MLMGSEKIVELELRGTDALSPNLDRAIGSYVPLQSRTERLRTTKSCSAPADQRDQRDQG